LKSKQELLNFLEAQRVIEKQIVDSLNNALNEMVNPAVKGTLRGISLDSEKHSELYLAAIKLLTSFPPDTTQEITADQLEKHKRLVEDHIALEVELINKLENTIPTLKNEKVELLLNLILQDEKEHHTILKKVLALIVEGETMTTEWWDVLGAERVPRW
jgi:hypothetical protein